MTRKSRVGAFIVRVRREGLICTDIWGHVIQASSSKGLACWRNSEEASVAQKMRLER